MILCRFCDRRNPPGRTHCESCGAELPQDPSAAPAQLTPAAGGDAGDLADEVVAILKQQGKIAAIKRYREATGLGLRESKEAVERLGVEAGVPSSGASGCAPVLAAVLATACLVGACVVAGAGRWPW